jgi:RNA polymerase sigma factor (sigma-70 family)
MTPSQREALYRRLLPIVSSAVRKAARRRSSEAELEDLIGEVWLHLVEKRVLEKHDPARGSVEQLFYVAARNEAISRLRSRRRVGWHVELKEDGVFMLDMPASGSEAESIVFAHRDVWRALAHFTEDDEEVLYLSLAYELTAAEILEVRREAVTEAKIGAMQKRLQRLKQRLGFSLAHELVAAEIRQATLTEAEIGAMRERLQRLTQRLGCRLVEVVSTPRAPERSSEESRPHTPVAEGKATPEGLDPDAKEKKR